MGYNIVKIETHLNDLEKKIPATDPRSNGDKWDKEVAKILAAECALAEKNIKSNLDLSIKTKNDLQVEMNRVEGIIKNGKGKIDSTMLSAIVSIGKDIQAAVKKMDDDINDLANANLQYRGAWPNKARGILKNQSILQPFLQPRETSINGKRSVNRSSQTNRMRS